MGEGQMALPLGLLAYGSQIKKKKWISILGMHVNLLYKVCDA